MLNEDSIVTKRLLSPSDMNKIVIENEMEMNVNKNEGDLRLHDAVYDTENIESIEEIEDLLAENADLVYERDDEGRTPLHTLAFAGDKQAPLVAKLLVGASELADGSVRNVERTGLLNLVDDKGYTALHYAARNWQPSLVISLLKFGTNPIIRDTKGNTPLHLACEGNSENALKCAEEILKYDKDGSFINIKNGDELTPIHLAVKEEAIEMFSLVFDEIYKFNLSIQDSDGNTLLHFLCLQPGKTKKACEIAKKIILKCSPSQLNQHDNHGRTALHIASIERLPQITKVLVEDKRTDVLRIDQRKRTALHYAAENGGYPKGAQCVEVLLTRKFPETNDLIRHLYQMEDGNNSNPFMYACLNCPVLTVQKYLDVIPEPQFWLTATSLILIYKEAPLAIMSLMDKAFSEKKKLKKDFDSENDVIIADFGPIVGYTDPVVKYPQQETKYLKQSLRWNYEIQKEILMHPLVQLFVFRKCQKLRAILYGWIFWQFLWLVAYTSLAVTFYCTGYESKVVSILASLFMLVYIAVSIINEIFEISAVGLGYISVTNLSQLVQIILGIIAICPVLAGYETPAPWEKHCTAMGILLACILSMRDVGKLADMIGLVVEILKQVIIQIIKVLMCCFPLLLGFTLAFIILFDNEESINTTFPGPLVKVLVMMTGEFEYNDTFNGTEENAKTLTTSHKAIRLIFFLSFLIAVPVAFFNLLTGYALNQVMELQERAKVGRISKQIEHIYFIESILLSFRLFRKFSSNHDAGVSWLRNRNVTTSTIDGELKFETCIQEETRKKFDRQPFKGRRMDLFNYISSISGNELPSECRLQILGLASSATSGDEKDDSETCNCSCPK